MESIKLPYGNGFLAYFPGQRTHHLLFPQVGTAAPSDQTNLIRNAIINPVNRDSSLNGVNSDTRVAISINDKTRPVPNSVLLSALIAELSNKGVPDTNIRIFIASGTHRPMDRTEFHLIISEEFINRFQILPHDCDEQGNLEYLGRTSNGTPVFMNKQFLQSDLRIVVGDIELHHFAGYSGGVKPAAIGLSARSTINANHSLLIDQNSKMGVYKGNPLREDIEEIGQLARIDLALNAVLNDQKEIIAVFFGKPVDVMNQGIEVVNGMCQVLIPHLFDIVIASAGGYPKDINLYQAQKAMTHASLFCKKGGKVILAAECREGAGSAGYLEFMKDITTREQVIQKFTEQGFLVGPHKAFLIAKILENHEVFLLSAMDVDLVRSLLLSPLSCEQNSIESLVKNQPEQATVAVLPYATACIPVIREE